MMATQKRESELYVRFLLSQLLAADKTLETLILCVPTGEMRNTLTEINISNMMAQEKLKNILKELEGS